MLAADEIGVASEATIIEKLAAAHALGSAERLATEQDLLISTALDFLLSGAASTDAVYEHCATTWVGSGLDLPRIARALAIAQSMQYVDGGETTWSLTPLGVDEAQLARAWADETLARASRQLAERAERGYRELLPEEAQAWVRLLVQALFAGLNSDYAAYRGEVDEFPGTITPKTYDAAAMNRVLASGAKRKDTREFLDAMLLDVLDPSEPFGNDLVTSVTTAYMIQAFLAGRDRLGALAITGGLQGRRAVLDTPAVLPMLGSPDQFQPLNRAIAAAVRSGMEVIVPEHVIEELVRLVDRFERSGVDPVVKAINFGAQRSAIRQLTNDPVLSLWLSGEESDRYASWGDFRDALRRLPGHLRRLGIDVRPHRNGAGDRVDECDEGLRRALASREHGRGVAEIERDANTMAMVWRTRRQRELDTAVWPTGWVITADTHMDPAYRRLEKDDPHPLTLTTSQWLGVIASAGDPVGLEDLARNAASLFAQEAALAVSTGYPAAAAAEIAKALRPDAGASETDLRVAQMSMARPSDVTALLTDPESAAAGVAAIVVAMRGRRMNAARERSARQLLSDRDAAVDHARTEGTRARIETTKRSEAEGKAGEFQAQLALERTARQNDAVLFKRRTILVAALVSLGFAVAWLFTSGYSWSASAGLLSIVVLLVTAYDWISDVGVNWQKLALAFVPQVASVVELIARWRS